MNSNTDFYMKSDYRNARLNKKRKLQRKRRLIFGSIALIMIVVVAFVTTQALGKTNNSDVQKPISTLANEETEIDSTNEKTTEPTQPSEKTPDVNHINEYDFSKAVPENEKVENDYFDDAVFIGDSRTEGLILNTGLTNAISYTHKGLMVDTAFTSPIINKNGAKVSVTEALKTTDFKKVYIMLGINETGWAYSNIFIEKYGKLIDEIKSINPTAVIYVQQILPVSEKVSSSHSYLKNEKIKEYNELIKNMAQEKKIYYIDAGSAVVNSNGYLPEEAATDGIHLNREYCEKWLNYLKTHTVSEKGEF